MSVDPRHPAVAAPIPVDPADPAFAAAPFAVYATLRAVGPAARMSLPNGRQAWVVSSHEHARAALADRRLRAEPPVRAANPARAHLETHMLNMDGAGHARLRGAVAGAFCASAVAALRPRVEELAERLLEGLLAGAHKDGARTGPVDLVDGYAFPLPVLVMCEVLGVPPRDRDALRSWTFTVSAPRASTSPPEVDAAWEAMHAYFTELIDDKRRDPGDDLFSRMSASDPRGPSGDELLGMAFLLLFAGYETTMNLIAGGALLLLEDPGLLRRLRSGALAWPDAVEELLRLASPLEGATWRHAGEDLTIGGVPIAAGDSVLVSLAGANHDPGAFRCPEAFDTDRAGPRHLAFGYGPHVCVGARLARMEAEVALSMLLARVPHLRLAATRAELAWRPGLLVRGPRTLPVRVDDPLEHLRAAGRTREAAGLRRVLVPRPANDDLLDLSSNDYLALARDPRVTRAAAAAASTWGAGATGSRLVTGTTALHADLERELAEHLGAAGALVLSSGYLANLGAIGALSGPGSLVMSDAQNHASIVDACRLSRARVAVVPHLDPHAVEGLLAARAEARALVVTDAVFSVDGDAAPLAELAAACRRQGALLVVDEAHALGVVGEGGRGGAWAAGLAGAPDVVLTATLSKSLGSQGGAILADRAVVDHLVDTCRAFIFDTALAPAAVGAARAALGVLRDEPALPARTREVARLLASLARDAGLVARDPAAAVVSVRIGDPHLAVAAARACLARGVRVGCFRPPSVPDPDSRLRLTARADLDGADLERVALALGAVARLLGARPAAGSGGGTR